MVNISFSFFSFENYDMLRVIIIMTASYILYLDTLSQIYSSVVIYFTLV